MDIDGLLTTLTAAREAGQADTFWLVAGMVVGALLKMGYRPMPDPVPIAADDHWRLRLDAEMVRGMERFATARPDDAHCTWHRYLMPPD